MRAFNREFGYKTRKHPFAASVTYLLWSEGDSPSCCRWIPSDNRKDCRPHSTVSISDGQSLDAENESYALHIERLLTTGSPTDAQHSRPQPSQLMLNTSLGDSQEDATCHDVIIAGIDDEQDNTRHPPLAADDQHESPVNICSPLLEHVDRSEDAIELVVNDEEEVQGGQPCAVAETEATSLLPPVQLEVDPTGSRRCHQRHNIGVQSRVVIHPTWLPTFQSENSDATKNVVHLGLDVSEPLVALPSSDEVRTEAMPSVK